MAVRTLVAISIAALLLLLGRSPSLATSPLPDVEDDDILRLLEEDDKSDTSPPPSKEGNASLEGQDKSNELDKDGKGDEPYVPPLEAADEKDVVVLTKSNFSEFVEKNQYVMVEFYAPWCKHCKSFAPAYAAAATALKETNVLLAKVDVTVEQELQQEYGIQGLPDFYFFVDGAHTSYFEGNTKDDILAYIAKQLGPGSHNITTVEDAQKILSSGKKFVVAFLDSLVGSESQELAAAAKLENDVDFYQTSNPEVADLFHISPEAKRPALVLIKQETDKLTYYDGEFSRDEIVDFVDFNKYPLVITFSKQSAQQVSENPIRKLVIFFAPANDSDKILPVFEDAARLFKGKLVFVFVDIDDKEVGKPLADVFGIDSRITMLGIDKGEDPPKRYKFKGDITLDNIKTFAENFVEGRLTPFYMSSPIPESNDGDVKVVVAKTFDEIVLDESKDVLLEVYAPWCGHCQKFEPIYNKMAKRLRGVESLVIAKMDASKDEHPRAKAGEYPTLLFFPAGKKSSDPVSVDTDRTAVEIYKFIKKHASIPFKVQTSTSGAESEGESEKESSKDTEKKSRHDEVKDEL